MVREAENRDLGPGTLNLSRNGEWAVLAPDNPLSPEVALIEVGTGQRTTVPQLAFGATSRLASDGSVMVLSERGSMSVAHPAGVWKRWNLSEIKSTRPVPQGKRGWFSVSTDGTVFYEDDDSL